MRFEEKSHCYAHHAQVQRDLVDWGMSSACMSLAGHSVLEFGAGTGLLTGRLLDAGATVRATDYADGMVVEGMRTYPAASWQRMDAWCPDEALGGRFDTVASSALLQWADKPEAVFKKWIQCVKPGGKLLVLSFAEPSLPELTALRPDCLPLAWRGPAVWRAACASAGWTVEQCETKSLRYVYPDARAFFHSLHDVGATRAGVLGVSALRRLLRDYDARYACEEGVEASWTFLLLSAMRPS